MIPYFQKGAEIGHARSQYLLGSFYFLGSGVPVNYDQSLFWLEKSAQQGDPNASKNLGEVACEIGDRMYKEQKYNEMITYFRKGAQAGHAKSQYLLGCFYILGQGVPKGGEQSLFWLEKAAQQNYEGARKMFLEQVHRAATPCHKAENYAAAFPLYMRAAQMGDAKGQLMVGSYYLVGNGVAKDPNTGCAWLKKAEAQGMPETSEILRIWNS